MKRAITFSFFLLYPVSLFAVTNPLKGLTGEVTSFGQLVANLGLAIVALAIPLATIAIIWLWFQLLVNAGNPNKLTDIKKRFFWVLIGLVVAIAAGVLAQILQNFLVSPSV